MGEYKKHHLCKKRDKLICHRHPQTTEIPLILPCRHLLMEHLMWCRLWNKRCPELVKVAWYGPRNRTRQETEDRSRNSSPQVHDQLWAPGNQLYKNITSMKIWSVRMEAKGKERWQLVSLYLCGSKPFLIKYRSYIKCHDSILNSQVETHKYIKKMKAGGASKTSGGGKKSLKRERQWYHTW